MTEVLAPSDVRDMWTAYEQRVRERSLKINAASERVAALKDQRQRASGIGNTAAALRLEGEEAQARAMLERENAQNQEADKSDQVALVGRGQEIMAALNADVDANEEAELAAKHEDLRGTMASKDSRQRRLQISRNLDDWSRSLGLPRILAVEPVGPSGHPIAFDSPRAYYLDNATHFGARFEQMGHPPENLSEFRTKTR